MQLETKIRKLTVGKRPSAGIAIDIQKSFSYT